MRNLVYWPVLVGSILGCPVEVCRAQLYGLDNRPAINGFLDNALPPLPPGTSSGGGWTTVMAFPNLTFANPVFLVAEPRTNRLYVCAREGMIHHFQNSPDVSTKTLFLDIQSRTQGYDDCGLLGMAFHPEFRIPGAPNRNYVYVYYNYTPSPRIPGGNLRPPATTRSYNRLSRFTVPDGSAVADPNSELVLINQFDEHLWHNGGGMFFGSDGFLYLINGDEGGADDNYNNTQQINGGLFSGVLRIDVDRNPARSHPIRRQPLSGGTPPAGWPGTYTGNYFIPNDNPWVSPDGSVLEEFWAIGVRSPHRMTFDPVTGQIWNGDVGQADREEVNLIVRGGNYQWAYREGTMAGPKATPNPLLGTDQPPVYDYPHADGNSCVIGGYVYRGSEHAADLYGKYIFGDNFSGRIWALTYNPNGPSTVSYLCSMPPGQNYTGLSSFGLDQNNEIYMCQMGASGRLWKLARTGSASPPPPALLSKTGVFTNLATLAPRPGLIPFEVNSPLWSDNAFKQRWIAVPNDGSPYTPDEQVSFGPTGEWSFPIGTVLVKHFELPVNETNASVRRRLETRFLVRGSNGAYYGLTYKWRADNSDADLLSSGLSEEIPVTTSGGTRTQTWYYPSQQECLTCHTPAAGFVLGVKTRQLNRDFTYPATGRSDNQLRTWNHLGLLNPALDEAAISRYDRLVPVSLATASLEHRVRSYLDANCAHCHRPSGVRANFDARFDTPLTNQNLVSGPVNNALGIYGARVIAAGSREQSILYLRLNTNGPIRMPPLARNVIDTNAVTALAAWIGSLAPPAPWQEADVGSVALGGDASFLNGAFMVQGSGLDVASNNDGFHFVYQPIHGNAQIIARTVNPPFGEGWTKAGVMIRETLAGDSRNAFAALAGTNQVVFQRRIAPGDSTSSTTGPVAATPVWLKLTRDGETFAAFSSGDRTNWTWVGSAAISMTDSAYAGMAVSAGANTVVNTAVFDSVQLLASPSIVSISVSGDNVTIAWTAIPGNTYRVQQSPRLDDAQWIDLPGDITATGSQAVKVDSPKIAPQSFYRIIAIP